MSLSDASWTMSEYPEEGTSGRIPASFALPVNGRPHRVESQRRALLMAKYVAQGMGLRLAARASGVSPLRALDLVESPDWLSLVDGLRDAA
jgi:hypothetical protein